MDLIDRPKFDGPPDVLVWKWPSENLRLGTQLVVSESQEALFLKGGQALDLFGPGTHTLTTANLPFLSRLLNLPFAGKTPFTVEIYFVSKAVAFAQDWGTRTPIMLLDPRYRVTIPLRGYGQYALRIDNSREFVVRVVGTSQGASAAATAKAVLESPIVTCVQQAFGDYLVQQRVSALELPAHTLALVEHATGLLQERYRTFGIELVNFTIESVNFDPKDESVVRLRRMLDEAARLELMGDAYRRNQDFYRAERQFDVLEGAAESGGAAGAVAGAAIGVGMGFGVAPRAGELAKQSMTPEPSTPGCAKCNAPYKPGAKFCNECGAGLSGEMKLCPDCKAENVATARFCHGCGRALGTRKCAKCGADLPSATKFCSECGESA